MGRLLIAMLLFPTALSAQIVSRLEVSRDSMPTYINETGDIGMTILLDQESVGAGSGLSLATFLPGASIAEHMHAGASESLYIMSGEIELTIGGRVVIGREGSAIYIPADTPHSARVRSSIEPVRAVQFYSPGGAEQRFKLWTKE